MSKEFRKSECTTSVPQATPIRISKTEKGVALIFGLDPNREISVLNPQGELLMNKTFVSNYGEISWAELGSAALYFISYQEDSTDNIRIIPITQF